MVSFNHNLITITIIITANLVIPAISEYKEMKDAIGMYGFIY